MSGQDTPERAVPILLVLASVGVSAALLAGWGWFRAANEPITAADLSSPERQALVEEMLAVSPGLHRWAWFEPRMGYTLRPEAPVRAWRDEFVTNELGYRTGPVAKEPGTFRVLFVGDSWTFGMGVEEAASYPKVFERLAASRAGADRPVEAWTLALPGYNTLNELAALWFFFDRLQPDLVVIAPTRNDNHSTRVVLPGGSLAGEIAREDLFGDPHTITYRAPAVASYRFDRRWAACFAALRETELRLARARVPMLLFFLDVWRPAMIHDHVERAGLEAPYVIVPRELTTGQWLNPPPVLHATAAANENLGRLAYQGIAALLEWPALPDLSDDLSGVPLFEGPPRDRDWGELRRLDALEKTRDEISESFRPGVAAKAQVVGPGDHLTGEFGRSTTILVRRADGRPELEIVLARAREGSAVYPLDVTVSIPTAAGASVVRTTLPASGPEEHRFRVPLPDTIVPGEAVDLILESELATAAEDLLRGAAFRVLSVEPAG